MRTDTPDTQLTLPFDRSADALGSLLEASLGRSVSLVLTDNSTSVLSARIRDGVLTVRLHRMFLHADERVVDEIVSYLKRRRCAMTHFRGFIRTNREQLRSRPANKVPIRTAGRSHDLSVLYDEINREYFGGRIAAAITWGSRSPRLAVRKRTVGSYSARSNTIRINPVLDRRTVPRCYVAFIVYHEMLHADLGTVMRGKRRSMHSREFRRREKLFSGYDQAIAWERGKP